MQPRDEVLLAGRGISVRQVIQETVGAIMAHGVEHDESGLSAHAFGGECKFCTKVCWSSKPFAITAMGPCRCILVRSNIVYIGAWGASMLGTGALSVLVGA